jgi:hypothetical protein
MEKRFPFLLGKRISHQTSIFVFGGLISLGGVFWCENVFFFSSVIFIKISFCRKVGQFSEIKNYRGKKKRK